MRSRCAYRRGYKNVRKDSHETVESVVYSLDGSPPKGYAIYIPELRNVSLYSNHGERLQVYSSTTLVDREGMMRAMSNAALEHETEVVWGEKYSVELNYICEFPVQTLKRRVSQIVVVADISCTIIRMSGEDAPMTEIGLVRKQMFVLKPTDHSGPANNGEYWQEEQTSAKAIEIDSIAPDHLSTNMQP